MENQTFDITMLLKMKDLDIRALDNREKPSLKTFRERLFTLISEVPSVLECLETIVSGNTSLKENTDLAKISGLLQSVGAYELSTYFNTLADGTKNNEAIAERTAFKFKDLIERVQEAQRKMKPEEVEDEHNRRSLNHVICVAEHEENTRKLRILCVDDNAFMLQTLSAALGDEYEVFSLSKAKNIEAFLKNNTPELFLLDYNMPDINGFELYKIIKNHEQHFDTPVIFLTASGTAERVQDALELGASDFIVKPMKAELLKEKIAKHIKRKIAF